MNADVEYISEPNRIVFPNLGIDFEINPTAFTVFGMDIKWYGIIITFGVLLAMLYCLPKLKKQFGLDPDRAIDVIISGIIGGVIGARVYYVVFKWDSYAGDIKSILNFRNGGLAIYGGIIGAIIVGRIACKIRKVHFTTMLDVVGIGFLIGQGIGRWGNFVNQEAFGCNTDNIFGMTGGTIQSNIINGNMTNVNELECVHPCFLYESVWCILGFIILAIFSKHRKFDGQVFLMYLTWYGIGRAVIEGLRTDSLMFGQIKVSQLLAIVLVIISVIVHLITLSKIKRSGEKYILYVESEESKNLIAQSD